MCDSNDIALLEAFISDVMYWLDISISEVTWQKSPALLSDAQMYVQRDRNSLAFKDYKVGGGISSNTTSV